MKLAIIMAAGMGSRLEGHSNNRPKGFIEFDGIPIIQRSIETLMKYGVDKIILGTGYQSDYYQNLKDKYPIQCIQNSIYDTTGSLYTLALVREAVDQDFLLLESDILYEERAIGEIINFNNQNSILISGETKSGDEVYIEADETNRFKKMSKKPNVLSGISGELTGISKISLNTYKKMCEFMDLSFSDSPGLHYEDGINYVSEVDPFFVKKIEDLLWCEVDDISHLERAKNIIYPKILKKENS